MHCHAMPASTLHCVFACTRGGQRTHLLRLLVRQPLQLSQDALAQHLLLSLLRHCRQGGHGKQGLEHAQQSEQTIRGRGSRHAHTYQPTLSTALLPPPYPSPCPTQQPQGRAPVGLGLGGCVRVSASTPAHDRTATEAQQKAMPVQTHTDPRYTPYGAAAASPTAEARQKMGCG